MSGLKEQIEEAMDRVAHYRLRAERPCARLEDEYALEKARTRLLTLELRCLRSELKSTDVARQRHQGGSERSRHDANDRSEVGKIMRTKHKHFSLSARERAEASFAALQQEAGKTTEDR
ncbi:hypothetical protein IWQ51_006483 [Labrenzia sp. EL_142]|nr:hypothetical protein [Labrenzia sp. EL_142]